MKIVFVLLDSLNRNAMAPYGSDVVHTPNFTRFQERSITLFGMLAEEGAEDGGYTLEYAVLHRDIVAQFGRFPHRNEILGRKSTPEEIAFLKEPNSSF